ncbi:anion exchange protein 2-like isoform X2 [Hydractinia symbiolongicarpus]|uniref:anion exchange protein 2-like isoform X2 n=1 Tax=Hydractinia symbiolongicarpus TaxID=13093 RepID=UPI00254BAE03|nr:anion exchange protein 2-like isoform X2 [Hydractinia symbiolongicarpus]
MGDTDNQVPSVVIDLVESDDENFERYDLDDLHKDRDLKVEVDDDQQSSNLQNNDLPGSIKLIEHLSGKKTDETSTDVSENDYINDAVENASTENINDAVEDASRENAEVENLNIVNNQIDDVEDSNGEQDDELNSADLPLPKSPDHSAIFSDEDDGLWFKGHTPLPSESEDEDAPKKSQCEKILKYEMEFALPIISEPFAENMRNKLTHNQHSFNEKDFIRHRKSSKDIPSMAQQIIHKKHKHHHKHHKRSSHKESKLGRSEKQPEDTVSNDVLHAKDKVDIGRRPKAHTISTLMPVGFLPSVSETTEAGEKDYAKSHEETFRKMSLQDNLEVPPKVQHRKKHKHGHHRHHHHARHLQNKHVTKHDTLELRIRSGMQTLEEERKALREVVSELGEEFGQKDIDDMTSHRFGNFQGSSKHLVQRKRHHRSGMTTHLSDVDSLCSVSIQRPHMRITMEENQIELAPREGFVELEELVTNEENELQWQERARWIKFEEDVEKNERWGKPHVASLSFQGLLELRRGIETGTVLLGLSNYDLPTIFESVVDNMIITDQISKTSRDRIIGVLLSKHCHHHQNKLAGGPKRRNSIIELSRESSISEKDSGLESVDGDVVVEAVNGVELNNFSLKPEEHTVDINLVNSAKHDSDYDDDDSVTGHLRTVKFAPITEEPKGAEDKVKSNVHEKIPEGAEATSVLVATLTELERPAMAFVRLAKGCYLGNLTEVVIPIRFLFIIMGPPSNHDYYEIGRSIATLMSDKVFHDLAYAAKNRDDILAAINSFLDDSIVLAPGDWDRHLLLPLLQAEISEKRKERIKLLKEKAHIDVPTDEQAFLRTGKPFGGLLRDIKKKCKFYASDFRNGFNWRCFVTIIFVFFATLAPTITFGALLSKSTKEALGVTETLLATSLCGVIFSLTSGQPLIIVGTTGPILVFELAIYDLCVYFNIDFLVWRFWTGMIVMLILWTVVAAEGCFLVEYFTRFTEEVFSILISLLFIYEALSFILKTLKSHPLTTSNDQYTRIDTNGTLNDTLHNRNSYLPNSPPCLNDANITLLSILLVFGTFFIAYYLRKLRFSHFLSSRARRVLSDFGVPIAMTLMVCLNFAHDIQGIPKIHLSHRFGPTSANRTTFLVNPFYTMKFYWVFLSILPAICVSILLFMETELTGVLLNKRKNKLKKGGGYNLDLFVMGALTGICSMLGFPWMCAATVRSVQHQNALAIMSRSHAPGEKPYLLHIKEQRLTNLCIHILIGCCAIAVPVIENIPVAVCLGVFLYLGISSMAGIQFIEQIKLIFVPMKYHPNRKYVRCVKFRSLVVYTLIQVTCLFCLIAIKLLPIAPAFPFFIIGMVFLRRFIERYFSEEELEDLDNEDDDDEFDEFDEYGTALPM